MKKIIFILFISSLINTFASENIGLYKMKKNEKCIKRELFPKHSMIFSYNQLCQYGKVGCNGYRFQKSIQVLCALNDVSSCFSQKQWVTANQLFQLSNDMKIIGQHSVSTITDGNIERYECIEYKKKKKSFVMSDEKFKQYKKMAPDVLEVMNNQIRAITQCFKKEKSQKNIDACLKPGSKTVEELIQSLIPSQKDKLCRKIDNQCHFVWSVKNYDLLIKELGNLVEKNKKHKECILKSNNIDELAKCMAPTRSQ